MAAAGARVAVVSRSTDELDETVRGIVEAGGHATAYTVDVSDAGAVEHMMALVEREIGPVDLLVNNASIIQPLGPVWEVAPDDWWRLLEINLLGTFLCARAALTRMTERGHGRIVNVASGAGIKSPPYLSAYVASKAAVIRLSEELAAETTDQGIAVFAIDPGWMSTTMTDYLANSDQGRKWTPSAPSIFGTDARVPTSRGADLVVALATGKGDSLSGRFITVWDDLDDLMTRQQTSPDDDLLRVRLRK